MNPRKPPTPLPPLNRAEVRQQTKQAQNSILIQRGLQVPQHKLGSCDKYKENRGFETLLNFKASKDLCRSSSTLANRDTRNDQLFKLVPNFQANYMSASKRTISPQSLQTDTKATFSTCMNQFVDKSPFIRHQSESEIKTSFRSNSKLKNASSASFRS